MLVKTELNRTSMSSITCLLRVTCVPISNAYDCLKPFQGECTNSTRASSHPATLEAPLIMALARAFVDSLSEPDKQSVLTNITNYIES